MTRSLRSRPTVTAVLLLAVLALGSVLEKSHSHKPLALANHHLDLPTFSTDHDLPDRTVHIEGATSAEESACIGCLLRQRQRALESLETSLDGSSPRIYAAGTESHRATASGAHRLPTSRAPPKA